MVLWSFFLLRLLCISINLPYAHAGNTVVTFGAPSCYLELLDKLEKSICRTVGPSLPNSLEPLGHRWNVASLKLSGHEQLFHEIARNFSNCCSFMKNFWVSPGIFLLLHSIFFSKNLFQQQQKFQITFFKFRNIFFEKKEFVKKVNKKHVLSHLQHELRQLNSF